MIDFARLKVQEALNSVVDRGENFFGDLVYSKDKILNAYPLDKIK